MSVSNLEEALAALASGQRMPIVNLRDVVTWLAGVSSAGLVPTAVQTSGYQAVAGDLVLCDPTGGAFAVAAPASPSAGQRFAVKNASVSTNAITITATVDGVINPTVQGPRAFASFAYTAEGWIST